MFLLILNLMILRKLVMNKFTFQYVSINTANEFFKNTKSFSFTFQYVSINTQSYFSRKPNHSHLHSNMFLLIPSSAAGLLGKILFTFQYVSINTNSGTTSSGSASGFTFQYVSINTRESFSEFPSEVHLHSNMFLLIPAPLNHRLILPYYTIFCRPWYFFIFLFISI